MILAKVENPWRKCVDRGLDGLEARGVEANSLENPFQNPFHRVATKTLGSDSRFLFGTRCPSTAETGETIDICRFSSHQLGNKKTQTFREFP